ncbi:DUF5610 domain-containing protein [Thiomicrospira sp. R3]|uniref:DUF5610 domain-containing protein n=1 Tax=Thiomicrospira sp. R3 TaxID=3035472 RepID=UPI00259B4B1C|nr:DUF5610 domain-containing protein [Thiomicrospira sp. R3]WFE68521.1 DUF5610 domain-containing protein [Thiomicrospira sp. R3]
MPIQSIDSNANTYQRNAAIDSNKKPELSADKQPGLVVNVGGVEQQASKETMKIQAQASIIQHLFGEGAPRDQNALKILFQETIEQLNQALEADLGPNAISAEKLAEQGGMDYWSAENTAGRIVQGTTAFFEAFKQSNPNLEGVGLLDKFLSVIGGGIESGFKDATDMLKGFGVFDGSVKDNAEKTYDLVQKGLQDFRAQQMEKMGLNPAVEKPEV